MLKHNKYILILLYQLPRVSGVGVVMYLEENRLTEIINKTGVAGVVLQTALVLNKWILMYVLCGLPQESVKSCQT